MPKDRPDPDELLRRVVEERARQQRGKLTLFFGAAPGVGKTYAMLEAARAAVAEGQRVLVGIVETHGRYETAALLNGLELLPRRKVAYRGFEVEEFDLDAALARHPDVILVDELAHSNAEGSRHPKRWQDVEELLEAGIDVLSTLNVQHVESLNDVIAKVTGIIVRETVPDSVIERAHEIKLVDLPPDDLLERLRDGKVYVPAQAQRAIEHFFRKGNLIALRELALRQTAERVDAQMRAYRKEQGIEQTWAVAEQILVAVSPSPFSARLVRAARRMAGSLHARWYAVYVEPRDARRLSRQDEARLSQNLRLAERLGADVVTLSGSDAAEELLRFAREHNITKIIAGKPITGGLIGRWRVSLVDRIVRQAEDIDVYVTAGDPDSAETPLPKPRARPLSIPGYASALAVVAVATGPAWLFGPEQLPDVVMIYLLGILFVSSRQGLGPSLVASVASVAAVDFFFVPPYLTFAVADLRHTLTFLVMLLVGVVVSALAERVRSQAAAATRREATTRALYELERELTSAQGSRRVIEVGAAELAKLIDSDVTVFLPGADGQVAAVHSTRATDGVEREASIAQWVWSHQREAGLGTDTLPSSASLYVPLVASGGIVGVLGLRPRASDQFESIQERRRVDTFAARVALALERAMLAEQTERARRDVETEQLRSTLLSSVSHDLRTPLAVITGCASTLLQAPGVMDSAARQELTKTILEEAERLNRLIRNLLDMTRLEAGAVRVQKELQSCEEVVGAALHRLEARLAGRDVKVELPADLPLVPFDAVLIEQVLINLLENALKYGQGAIEVNASKGRGEVVIEVSDRGPGVPAGQESRIFEKFQRAAREGGAGGVGLGLTICRAIVAAHGGRIWAKNREGGGATLTFTLPMDGEPLEPQPSPPDTSAMASAPP
jgi:two-component system sensor histidine kinase KdpD